MLRYLFYHMGLFSFLKLGTIFHVPGNFYWMVAITYEKFEEVLSKLLATGRQAEKRQSNFEFLHIFILILIGPCLLLVLHYS